MSTATMPAVTADFALGFRAMMLESLAQEMQTTRKVILAVPEGKKDWRPDPKARTAAELAWHIASTDVWFLNSLADQKFDWSGDPAAPGTIAEIASWYEKEFNAGLRRVEALRPEQLTVPMDFMGAFNLPAFGYLSFLSNHLIHHRGQLSTYLRPMGSKVPSIYGGSADEPWEAEKK